MGRPVAPSPGAVISVMLPRLPANTGNDGHGHGDTSSGGGKDSNSAGRKRRPHFVSYKPSATTKCTSDDGDTNSSFITSTADTSAAAAASSAYRKLARLHARFCARDAELAINVSAVATASVEAAVTAHCVDPRAVEPAMSEVLRLLAGGPVTRFAASTHFEGFRAAATALLQRQREGKKKEQA